ncbi:MAG TPA: histidinol-phosphate transaminase [Anditalea sp.]|nr:histidinol-phosphate transaminase [Anditalea sp.]
MKINRRDWLKSAALTGGAGMIANLGFFTSLTAEQKKKFNPRRIFDKVRLSSNENPYGPSEIVREALTQSFADGCRYPYSYQEGLLDMLAEKEGVNKDHIVITGGSTEALKVAGIIFTKGGGELIASKPTFLAMMDYAQMWGAAVNWVPVDEQMHHNLSEMESRINSNTKMVFICNPNNPTSTLLPADKFEEFSRRVSDKTILFSDEAYYEYIDKPNYPSMVKLVKEGKNVIVSRTFSKVYGLAGLRIGYIIAKPELAKSIRENVVAFTNVYALEAAKTALKDEAFYNFSLLKNSESKKAIYHSLKEIDIPYLDSQTNFIFFKTGKPITEIHAKFMEEGIMVGRAFPPYEDWCRVSTGTYEETERFITALKKVIT